MDELSSTLQGQERPIIHSERGAHYRWPDWIERMNKANLTRSMSKKGCSPDNLVYEGFFGRLKNEVFYQRDWKNTTINQFINQLDNYVHWYNHKRIKLTLGGLSPLQYRKKQRCIFKNGPEKHPHPQTHNFKLPLTGDDGVSKSLYF